MADLKGKKLLVIGGAFQHCKLVEAAKELGVTVYVTDYLPVEKAPAKQIADKYFMYNITEIDEIAEMCKREGVDGVISTSLDACQKPYFKVCQKLGFPCFGTEEQFTILTDKSAFKAQCIKSGVDVISKYSKDDFKDKETCDKNVEFPILIKPCVSRGSRGQSICDTYEEALKAIAFASEESDNGEILIEKYMGQANDFSMTILVINGKVIPIRTVDRILGKYEDGLDKLAVGSAQPSVFTRTYMEKAHHKIEKFAKDIGLNTAPMFMQGFVDGDKVRFYDPGLRLPGGEFERIFIRAFGKNPMYPLIEYALTGAVSEEYANFSEEDVNLNGKLGVQMLIPLRPGKISKIVGADEIKKHPDVVSMFEMFEEGDTVIETHNVKQRFCAIDAVRENKEEMTEFVKWVFDTLKVYDENGEDMIISKFDTNYFLNRKYE